MARINDVGGMEGFGPIDPGDDPAPFHADWEARVFALVSALLQQGAFELDEFRDAIEQMAPEDYLAASYYERWFAALRTLLADKHVLTPDEVDRVLAAEDPDHG